MSNLKPLGEVAPEFTPVGGEDVYNAGKAVVAPKAYDMYETLMRRGMGGKGK